MKPWRGCAAALLLALPGCSQAQPTDPHSLSCWANDLAPRHQGRIDHLAVDLADHRLFVAEIANGTVDEVDLEAGKVIGRIAAAWRTARASPGFRRPTGGGRLR
jgi:hypothetical protein